MNDLTDLNNDLDIVDIVDIIDNDNFITVRADEIKFIQLSHDDKIEAAQYMINVKKALEDNGAIVLLTRGVVK